LHLPTLRGELSSAPPESPRNLRRGLSAPPRENRRALGFPATLVEFGAPSTHEPERVHFTPVCLTGYVPPTGFYTLSAAFSSLGRPALFHADNVHGVLPFRGFPSQPGPIQLVAVGLPSWPSSDADAPCKTTRCVAFGTNKPLSLQPKPLRAFKALLRL
jgi:hypothetical protein